MFCNAYHILMNVYIYYLYYIHIRHTLVNMLRSAYDIYFQKVPTTVSA